jgi:hypothetical protein
VARLREACSDMSGSDGRDRLGVYEGHYHAQDTEKKPKPRGISAGGMTNVGYDCTITNSVPGYSHSIRTNKLE